MLFVRTCVMSRVLEVWRDVVVCLLACESDSDCIHCSRETVEVKVDIVKGSHSALICWKLLRCLLLLLLNLLGVFGLLGFFLLAHFLSFLNLFTFLSFALLGWFWRASAFFTYLLLRFGGRFRRFLWAVVTRLVTVSMTWLWVTSLRPTTTVTVCTRRLASLWFRARITWWTLDFTKTPFTKFLNLPSLFSLLLDDIVY